MPLYIWLALEKTDLGSAQYLLVQVRLLSAGKSAFCASCVIHVCSIDGQIPMPPTLLMPLASRMQSRAQEQDLVKVEVQREPTQATSPKAGIVPVGLKPEELVDGATAL